MEYSKALDQISAIHEHLAKGEIYAGYRPLPVALTGVVGFVAAFLQTQFVDVDHPWSFCFYWIAVAMANVAVGAGAILYNYAWHDQEFSRRRTRHVVGQFVPCLLAGLGVTLGIAWVDTRLVTLLPGLWALLYGLGMFASRPYLPRAIGWVALFYLLAGVVLLAMVRQGTSLSPWGLGLTFGLGQTAAALVLYWNLERQDHGWQETFGLRLRPPRV